ncbi:uncharacterized protein [Penaeus vannamei]|uniref:uncharacterized protein n=1 Tax=Penaeus vannamei TaxID=6689 RepID=UPI00387F6295
MTNAWPILKTVYQTEYIKEAIDYVTAVIETSTKFLIRTSIKHTTVVTFILHNCSYTYDIVRYSDTERSSSLKQLAITISMSFNMKTLVLWTALSLFATCEGLEPDLPVKACQEEFSSVSLTSTRLQVSTVVSTVTLLDVVPTSVVGTTTATAVSTASVVKTVTASTAATQTYTQVDVFTSITYLPVYLTTTMTNAWPILKTVYQTEYIKEAVDFVTTVIETSTVYDCQDANGY